MVAGRVFSRLVEDVLSGRYEPGEKLPTQRALAAELDVMAHVLFGAGGLDQDMLGQLMEARRLMLGESARLAAERRDGEQARRLESIAERIAVAPDDAAAQALDFA